MKVFGGIKKTKRKYVLGLKLELIGLLQTVLLKQQETSDMKNMCLGVV